MLTEEDIEEFQDIFKKTFKKAISHKEAKEYANELYELYGAVYLPVEPDKILIKTQSIG